MAIRIDIPIEITALEVSQALCRGRRDASWMQEQVEEAVEQARKLWSPCMVYEWIDILSVTGEAVRVRSQSLDAEVILNIGPHTHLVKPALKAFISVNTIGPRLDETVGILNRQGEMLAAYLMDSVGVVALSKVSDAANRMVETYAGELGWGVGDRLSPGSLKGWPTSGQREICALLDLNHAGLSLSDSGLLVPFKSASGFIGIGPEYKRQSVGSVCSLCNLKETCWRRKI